METPVCRWPATPTPTTLENQRRVLADCEQVFEDVGSGASWNRPGLNRLRAALQPGTA